MPPAASTRLSEIWASPGDARDWVVDVVGENIVTTCDTCRKDSIPGTGLLPKLHQESSAVTTDLQNLVSGATALTLPNLEDVTAPGIAITRQVVEAIREHQPVALAMSALLTTTMPYMKVVIDTMVEQGIRDDYVVLVGGAPLNEQFAEAHNNLGNALARLLAACRAARNPWLLPVVQLALETAMRQGELLRLRWTHNTLSPLSTRWASKCPGHWRHQPAPSESVSGWARVSGPKPSSLPRYSLLRPCLLPGRASAVPGSHSRRDRFANCNGELFQPVMDALRGP